MSTQSKTLQQLTIEELAAIHLTRHQMPTWLADGYIESGMGYLVTEITQSLPRVHTGFFSPLYGAFALLDQIGEIYTRSDLAFYPHGDASGIKKSLYYFGGMQANSPEVKALYGLRNSLMHNGSLLYRGRWNAIAGCWDGPFHRFRWNKQLNLPVRLPSILWDGNLDNITPENMTEINVEEICRLALRSLDHTIEALKENKLVINVNEGEKEIYYRYLHHTSWDILKPKTP